MSTTQLRALGLGRGAIELQVRRRRLHRVHRGVYAVGHRRLTERGRLWAAVLACGGREVAVLSHRSAASLWDLRAQGGPVEVTTLRGSRSAAGIRVHRGRLEPSEIVFRDGLPVTTPMRTLLDLALTVTPHELERLCHRAELLRLLDARQIPPGRRGAHRLRTAIATLRHAGPQITRSALEERFLALVARAGLPRPRVNAQVADLTVDFLWPERKLIVETDGAAAHLTQRAFEDDRRRDARLQLSGYRVVRFTWHQVVDDPGYVVATLRGLLS